MSCSEAIGALTFFYLLLLNKALHPDGPGSHTQSSACDLHGSCPEFDPSSNQNRHCTSSSSLAQRKQTENLAEKPN